MGRRLLVTWVARHVLESGEIYAVAMSGRCPFCSVLVALPRERHGHELDAFGREAAGADTIPAWLLDFRLVAETVR